MAGRIVEHRPRRSRPAGIPNRFIKQGNYSQNSATPGPLQRGCGTVAEFGVGVLVVAGAVLRPLRFMVWDGVPFDGPLTPHQGAAA